MIDTLQRPPPARRRLRRASGPRTGPGVAGVPSPEPDGGSCSAGPPPSPSPRGASTPFFGSGQRPLRSTARTAGAAVEAPGVAGSARPGQHRIVRPARGHAAPDDQRPHHGGAGGAGGRAGRLEMGASGQEVVHHQHPPPTGPGLVGRLHPEGVGNAQGPSQLRHPRARSQPDHRRTQMAGGRHHLGQRLGGRPVAQGGDDGHQVPTLGCQAAMVTGHEGVEEGGQLLLTAVGGGRPMQPLVLAEGVVDGRARRRQ